jgi:hypothetical protein
LIANSDTKVKLHATLINTRYRKVSAEKEGLSLRFFSSPAERFAFPSRKKRFYCCMHCADSCECGTGGFVGGRTERLAVDVRPVLADFANADFGQLRIASVDLSQRGKFDDNGFYHRVTAIKLP